MTDKYKLFGSNQPDAVPQHILDRRVTQIDKAESHRANTKRILGASVVSALAVVAGVNEINNNRAEPVRSSNPVEITATVNGHQANVNVPAEQATAAQRYAQEVQENDGLLPGTP